MFEIERASRVPAPGGGKNFMFLFIFAIKIPSISDERVAGRAAFQTSLSLTPFPSLPSFLSAYTAHDQGHYRRAWPFQNASEYYKQSRDSGRGDYAPLFARAQPPRDTKLWLRATVKGHKFEGLGMLDRGTKLDCTFNKEPNDRRGGTSGGLGLTRSRTTFSRDSCRVTALYTRSLSS